MKRLILRKSIKRGIKATLRLASLIICGFIAIYIMQICITTIASQEQIHDQIEEEIFNNTYGKNIKVVPEVTKWKNMILKNNSWTQLAQ